MKRPEREGPGEIKRRIAATAAAATLAVSGSAAAAGPASARTSSPRSAARTTPLARSAVGAGTLTTDALRRRELAAHRRLLAGALAVELDGVDEPAVEAALAQVDAELAAGYGGTRRGASEDLATALGSRIGADGPAIERAFESMSRHALQRRIRRAPG